MEKGNNTKGVLAGTIAEVDIPVATVTDVTHKCVLCELLYRFLRIPE
jgi:hypothetical protein